MTFVLGNRFNRRMTLANWRECLKVGPAPRKLRYFVSGKMQFIRLRSFLTKGKTIILII